MQQLQCAINKTRRLLLGGELPPSPSTSVSLLLEEQEQEIDVRIQDQESRTLLYDDEDSNSSTAFSESDDWSHYSEGPSRWKGLGGSTGYVPIVEQHSTAVLVSVLSIGWFIGLIYVFPFFTTVHCFISILIALFAWTAVQWFILITHSITNRCSNGHSRSSKCSLLPQEWSTRRRIAVFLASLLSLLVLFNSIPPGEASPNQLPILHQSNPDIPEKYFIAANLYNSVDVFDQWSSELLSLVQHLGPANVFISIAESNSKDSTKALLTQFDSHLTHLNIPHRVSVQDNKNRWWPYGTSPERVTYLAGVRNKALEPIQSEDPSLRIPDYSSFTKIVFLNDIYFSWQSIIRLLATRLDGRTDIPSDYDLACALDFGDSGFRDTWVARDVCGTPFRAFWPYARDSLSVDRVKREEPFEVATCWNGVTAFPAAPYTWKEPVPPVQTPSSSKMPRGWRMIDNATYAHSVHSPELPNPLKFRGLDYDAPCDMSECFLFSYDIHRLYNGTRRPRILVNPNVRVAYEPNWFRWQNTVLEVPVVRFWLKYWSRGWPFKLVDWIYEAAGRGLDYCTWAGLQTPERCIALPVGGTSVHWWNG